MRLHVRGYLDGYYVGRPDAQPRGPGGAPRYRIELYRATFDRIQPVEVQGEPGATATTAEAGGLRQARLPHTRIYSPEGRGRVFEGVLTDVHLPEPSYAGKARQGEAIYGRLSGWATASLELPESAPEREPEPVEEIVSATPLPASEGGDGGEGPAPEGATRSPGDAQEPPAAVVGVEAPDSVEAARASQADVEARAAAALELEPAPTGEGPTRSTSLLLVGAIVVAIVLGTTASGTHAGIWLTLALPTLMFRRLFHGMLEDIVGVRGLAVALVLAQLAATAYVGAAFSVGGCHPLPGWALVVGLGSVFLAGLLPWRLPLIVTGLGFALMLWAGAQPRPARCREPDAVGARSLHVPSPPRTNPDGSWPRRPQAP